MRYRICGLLLLASLSLPAMPEEPFSFDPTPGQLPKTVVPEDYTLSLAPDVEKKTFEGNVSIKVRVREPVDRIVLNAEDLDIKSATIATPDVPAQPLRTRLDPKRQTLTLELGRRIPAGSYTLDIAYSGRINQQTHGLYFGRYNTPSGEKVMLSTQMEPVDARRMLPCWDEPVFRATFQTSVDLPESWTPYSNMPVEASRKLPNGLKRTQFHRTPKMASYLVVLVAGELERLEGDQDGVNIGIVTTAGKKHSGEYALKISKELLHYYNEYFGIAYPLPKLDQFAVTGTAGFGAMENWGGITYDESILLFDPKISSDSTRRDIYEVVAHEMAHQWFGDLVTMAWWDNLWLNEGFASWMETKATAHFNPDWGAWQAVNSQREAAMSLDARKTTHPIQQPVRNESEANSQFDLITYNKGMSFLRMLETWLGEEAFRNGMRAYMARHQYSSTTTADLWGALESASGKPVRRMASNWTEQPGFPVVKVAATCEKGERRISLRQEQFKVDGQPGERLWAIPVGIAAGGPTTFELLDQRTLYVTRSGCTAPVIVDPDAVGYYRVEYAPELLADLTGHWKDLKLDSRLKLLSDAWALAGVGRMKMDRYLALLEHARGDPEPALWNEIVNRLLKLDALARGEPLRPGLRAFAVSLLKPRLDALGWESRAGDSQETLELRPRLISVLGRFGDAAVRAEALARFRKFVEKPDSLPAAIADPVLFIAGLAADAATQDILLTRLRAAPTSEEQARYLEALTAAEDAALARKTLELSVGETLPNTLAMRIPRLVAVEHPTIAWEFAKKHHKRLQPRLVSLEANHWFGGIVAAMADKHIASDLEEFAQKNLPAGAMTETRRLADGIRFNAQLKGRLLPQLARALDKPQRSAHAR